MSRVLSIAIVNVAPTDNTKQPSNSAISMKLMWWVIPLGEHVKASPLKWENPYYTNANSTGPNIK